MMSGADQFQLSSEPLDVGRANAVVTSGGAGGIAIFAGTTRAEKRADGAELVALDYEAYPEMAMKQLASLAARARERWPIETIVLWHRVGRVRVGEPSVVIAVSAPHRAEAFEACRFLIDTLKVEVAIWKKEVWADGSTSWVDPNLPKGAPASPPEAGE